jgi:hypothetical protein
VRDGGASELVDGEDARPRVGGMVVVARPRVGAMVAGCRDTGGRRTMVVGEHFKERAEC